MSNHTWCDRHRVRYHVDDGCPECNELDRFEQMQKSLGKLRTDLEHKDAEIARLRKELDEARELADRFRDASDIFAEYNIRLKQDLTTCRKELDAERGKIRAALSWIKTVMDEPYKQQSMDVAEVAKRILTGEG